MPMPKLKPYNSPLKALLSKIIAWRTNLLNQHLHINHMKGG